MKKFIALLLSILLTVSLCACAGEQKEDLTGTWSAGIEMADVLNLMMNEADRDILDPAMAEYLQLESFAAPIILTLKEDSTFYLSLESTAWRAELEQVMQIHVDAMADYSREVLGKDLDEVLAAKGMTRDDAAADLLESIPEEFFALNALVGWYETEDGRLYVKMEEDQAMDLYFPYMLDGDSLVLTAGELAGDPYVDAIFPIILTRLE